MSVKRYINGQWTVVAGAGVQGPTGPTGPAGATGPTGPTGPAVDTSTLAPKSSPTFTGSAAFNGTATFNSTATFKSTSTPTYTPMRRITWDGSIVTGISVSTLPVVGNCVFIQYASTATAADAAYAATITNGTTITLSATGSSSTISVTATGAGTSTLGASTIAIPISSTPVFSGSSGAYVEWAGASTNLVAATDPSITRPILTSPIETITVSATAATGTINFDAKTQGVLYYTTASSGNWTLNIRGDSSTTLNSWMATGQSITIVFMATNTTAYYQSALTIDGSAVTPKWQGGTAVSSGNANAVEAYTMTVIKTASATYTALVARTKFA